MIDIHTHILPCIDDGSQSIEESAKMLEIMASSGIKKVVATPHYYNDRMSVEGFVENRKNAFDKISGLIPDGMQIILGAEVKLEYNIHNQDLKRLSVEGTDYILIEMPYTRWDDWVFEDLFKISSRHNLEVIIAHIDRYIGMVSSEKINKLFELDLKYQVNVGYLGGLFKKSVAMKLMQDNVPHFIGSDCHNLSQRPPCLGDAVSTIAKKCGTQQVEYYMSNGEKMISNKKLN